MFSFWGNLHLSLFLKRKGWRKENNFLQGKKLVSPVFSLGQLTPFFFSKKKGAVGR
jgi:hypothetical protein